MIKPKLPEEVFVTIVCTVKFSIATKVLLTRSLNDFVSIFAKETYCAKKLPICSFAPFLYP